MGASLTFQAFNLVALSFLLIFFTSCVSDAVLPWSAICQLISPESSGDCKVRGDSTAKAPAGGIFRQVSVRPKLFSPEVCHKSFAVLKALPSQLQALDPPSDRITRPDSLRDRLCLLSALALRPIVTSLCVPIDESGSR